MLNLKAIVDNNNIKRKVLQCVGTRPPLRVWQPTELSNRDRHCLTLIHLYSLYMLQEKYNAKVRAVLFFLKASITGLMLWRLLASARSLNSRNCEPFRSVGYCDFTGSDYSSTIQPPYLYLHSASRRVTFAVSWKWETGTFISKEANPMDEGGLRVKQLTPAPKTSYCEQS